MNLQLDFLDEMAKHGVMPADGRIHVDGELHRYRVEGDKPGTLNGWYKLHPDGIPAGAFGSWKEGVTITWSAKPERCERLLEIANKWQFENVEDKLPVVA